MRALYRLACLLCLLAPWVASPVRADEPAPEHHSWWWSWGQGMFGLSLGGLTYGSGPNPVIGSDKLVHQTRPVSGVHALELRGPIDVVLKQGDAERVTVHTDDNLAELIETPVVDGVLHVGIRARASFKVKHPIGVTVELPHLDAVKMQGSGDLNCSQFDTDLLEITLMGSGDARFDALRVGTLAVLVQGSGNLSLSGNAPKQGYVIEGSGDIDADELIGRNVAIRISGSGDAKLMASATLSVEIAGSGDVDYRGEAILTKNVHGSGNITHH